MSDDQPTVPFSMFRQIELAKQEWEKTMDCVGDVVIFVDGDHRIKRCNRPLTILADKGYSELLGLDWRELFDALQLRETGGAGDGFELSHPPSGRSFRSLIYPLNPLKDGLAGAVITLQDITKRKWMTAELEAKSQEIEQGRSRLQQALDELSLMISQVTEQREFDIHFNLPVDLGRCWEVMACNQPACPCHGQEPMRCWQVAGTQCGGNVQGKFAQKIGDCTGCRFYQEAIRDPIYHIVEKFNHMMCILKAKQKELASAYTELKASQAKLFQQEKMASIGQLAAGVAHEINNPMGFITSNLGTLGKYVTRLREFVAGQTAVCYAVANPSQQEELDRLRKELKVDYILKDAGSLVTESLDGADRVRTIVRNLKSFSRVDQAEESLADLNQCLEETITIIWNELKYRCEVKKEYGELPPLKCYPQQLNQVFMNLLVNAAQAITDKGAITIRSWVEQEEIRVAITDTGCGIPADKIDRIFEPFFTTKEVGKGTGLGLSITYDIVRKHQGRIEVASEPGRGSTFTVCLPIGGRDDG